MCYMGIVTGENSSTTEVVFFVIVHPYASGRGISPIFGLIRNYPFHQDCNRKCEMQISKLRIPSVEAGSLLAFVVDEDCDVFRCIHAW